MVKHLAESKQSKPDAPKRSKSNDGIAMSKDETELLRWFQYRLRRYLESKNQVFYFDETIYNDV